MQKGGEQQIPLFLVHARLWSLSILTQSFNLILDFHAPMVAHRPEEQRAAHAAQLKALAVIGDRLDVSKDSADAFCERWTSPTLQRKS